MSNELADKEYWQRSWEKSSKSTDNSVNPFKEQLAKHVPFANKDEIALEIGCVPGAFLGYLGRDFGYIVHGIDYVSGAKKTTLHTLKKFGIENAEIFEADFLSWTPPRHYELICSFGFIEHFVDVNAMVKQHIDALKPGGTLILEIPNFSGMQFFLHHFLDRENLERHNTEIMNLNFFMDIASRHNLTIKCLEYTGGVFDFWWENEKPTIMQKIVFLLLRPFAYVGRKISIKSRFTSPFIILIASKKQK
jgi:trans-aconitate methyltransferase